jgi:monofunctional biosynthetic peptidoglycan transglycosylase
VAEHAQDRRTGLPVAQDCAGPPSPEPEIVRHEPSDKVAEPLPQPPPVWPRAAGGGAGAVAALDPSTLVPATPADVTSHLRVPEPGPADAEREPAAAPDPGRTSSSVDGESTQEIIAHPLPALLDRDDGPATGPAEPPAEPSPEEPAEPPSQPEPVADAPTIRVPASTPATDMAVETAIPPPPIARVEPMPVHPTIDTALPMPHAPPGQRALDWPAQPADLPRPATDVAPGVRHYAAMALRLAGLVLTGLALLISVLIVLYRWVDPPASTLMLGQRLGGTPIVQHWVPLERISLNLQQAVILSEDGAFCRHRGVDWSELEEAIDRTRDGIARGGSTITMQLVKNLFLWPAKSYLRKAIEIPLAYVVEAAWGKRRILELYLNVAEWGPGVFGAEAAARYHFRKPASVLLAREAALLAVALPNPFERHAGNPGPGTLRLAENLMTRLRFSPRAAACVRALAKPS